MLAAYLQIQKCAQLQPDLFQVEIVDSHGALFLSRW